MGLVRIGRWYIAALGLAIVALGAFLLAWSGQAKPTRAPTARELARLETGALRRFRLPGRFVPLTRGCLARRCYFVAMPSAQVAAEMPALLRARGFERPGRLRLAEPVALLRQSHWSTASRDPLVIACKTTYVPGKGRLTRCQDAGRTGETLLNVLIVPFQPCRSQACADPHASEVLTSAVADPTTS
jgi:hypothetical protein